MYYITDVNNDLVQFQLPQSRLVVLLIIFYNFLGEELESLLANCLS